MATSRYLQPRQPGGAQATSTDPNGVYIPGRRNRLDARPRNALYLPGTGPGTGRTGIRTGIVNRDGTTSPVSSMGYATGPLSPTRPSSLPDPKNQGGANTEAPESDDTHEANAPEADTDTPDSEAPETGSDTAKPRAAGSGGQTNRELNPNAPLVYNPINLDNPGGSFVMQGATIADSSYMPEEGGGDAPQDSEEDPPRKRIDARPRNNIYMPGTGPGTGRTAIRIGTRNRDGSTSPVASMGYATGPLSETRPSSLPDKKPAATPAAAPGNTAATPGLPETIKPGTQQFGSNGEQNLKPPAPLTPAVIPSSIDLPSSSTPKTAPNAITPGVPGTIQASTQQFGSQPGTPKPAPAPAAKPLSSDLNTLKTSTKPALGSTPPLNPKAPGLSLTPSLSGIPTPKPSTGLDTLGGSKPFGSTSMSGPLDLSDVKKRAMGGPVRAGQPYLVGEEGPELIVPKRSGTVVPNHALQFQPDDGSEEQGEEYHAEAQPTSATGGFEDGADDAAAPADRPTTGLMMRPRPMPPEYEQQRQQASRGPAFSRPSGSQPTAMGADAPPAAQHPGDAEDAHGMPWDNHPPETATEPPATASRWFQKRRPPGVGGTQPAMSTMQGQQGRGPAPSWPQQGMQRLQAAAPAAQQKGGGSAMPKQDHYTGPVINAVDAQQNSATKSVSKNKDKVPGELEYALKFIAGTFIDGPLNTAVAVFGGPGKYSYNPNPVRRAWGVDDPLPKMDRRSYNDLQDGVEMLTYALTGATNPKNRVQITVPAPTWRNESDNSSIDTQTANRWLKEYRSNILKTGSGEYQVGVEVEGKNNLLLSKLDRGTLEFAISRGTNDGTMSGGDMFKSMMKFYGPAVKAVEGNWIYGDNLAEMNALTQGGRMSLEQAAKMTWTGRQAAAHGFTEVEIIHFTGEGGKLANMKVTFRKKPEN